MSRALSMLRKGSFERRPKGWYFGITRIPDALVERLIAAGKARRAGDRIELEEAAR